MTRGLDTTSTSGRQRTPVRRVLRFLFVLLRDLPLVIGLVIIVGGILLGFVAPLIDWLMRNDPLP